MGPHRPRAYPHQPRLGTSRAWRKIEASPPTSGTAGFSDATTDIASEPSWRPLLRLSEPKCTASNGVGHSV